MWTDPFTGELLDPATWQALYGGVLDPAMFDPSMAFNDFSQASIDQMAQNLVNEINSDPSWLATLGTQWQTLSLPQQVALIGSVVGLGAGLAGTVGNLTGGNDPTTQSTVHQVPPPSPQQTQLQNWIMGQLGMGGMGGQGMDFTSRMLSALGESGYLGSAEYLSSVSGAPDQQALQLAKRMIQGITGQAATDQQALALIQTAGQVGPVGAIQSILPQGFQSLPPEQQVSQLLTGLTGTPPTPQQLAGAMQFLGGYQPSQTGGMGQTQRDPWSTIPPSLGPALNQANATGRYLSGMEYAIDPMLAQLGPLSYGQSQILNSLVPTGTMMGGGQLPITPGLEQTVEQAFSPQMGDIATQAIESARKRGFAGGADLLQGGPAGSIAGPALADLQGQMAQAKLQYALQIPQTAAQLAGAFNEPLFRRTQAGMGALEQGGNLANVFTGIGTAGGNIGQGANQTQNQLMGNYINLLDVMQRPQLAAAGSTTTTQAPFNWGTAFNPAFQGFGAAGGALAGTGMNGLFWQSGGH